MRLLAIAGAIAVGVLCGLGLSLRPAAAQQMRLTIPALCSPLPQLEASLRRDGYRLALRAVDTDGDAFKVYMATDGRWTALSLVSASDGTAMGCPVLSGEHLALGEGA